METAQPLHPESKAVIELAAKLGVKPYTELTVEQARARSKASNAHPSVAGNVTYEGTRKELFIPLPDFTGTRTIIIQGFIQAPLGGGGNFSTNLRKFPPPQNGWPSSIKNPVIAVHDAHSMISQT